MGTRYALRTGEYLAISADAIKRDADGFFLLLDEGAPGNETKGSVVIVNIRGALQHYKGSGGDSYEGILERVTEAFAADPPPSNVVLRIESPGGMVAGLNECVLKLQRMSKAAKIPLTAYVDEMAASAAYALCCACEEVLAPPSAIIGSIGVISSMISVAKADEREGIEFRIITSGKRKADGHLHMPLTDAAVRAETARNTELAAQFFALAGKARGIAPKKIQALEAAIYLGKEAKRVGLIDDVMSLDTVLGYLRAYETAPTAVGPNDGNITDRRAKDVDKKSVPESLVSNGATESVCATTPREPSMSVKLSALIKKTEAAITAEADPRKRVPLQAKLSALLVARAEMDDDDGDDDGDEPKKKPSDDDDGDDESKAKKAAMAAKKAKAKAESAKHRAKAAEHKQKAAESEEAAKKCEEEASGEEGDDEAHLRVTHPSSLSEGAAAAIAAQAELGRDALSRIEQLEKSAADRELRAMIEEARAARRITPKEAKTLSKKSSSFVRDFLEMRPKALVATSEEQLDQPDGTPAADIPAAVKRIVEQAVTHSGLEGEKAEKFRQDSYAEHRKALAQNGVTH